MRTDGARTGSNVWDQAAAADADIESAAHDVHDEDLASAIEACLNRDGETAARANIPFGGNRITGLGSGVARTDSVTLGQAQLRGFNWAGTVAGTSEALTASLTPAITAYSNGLDFWFIVASDNAADDPTINLNTVGALPLESSVGVGVTKRQLRAGAICHGVVVGVGGTPSVLVVEGLTIETLLARGYIDGFQVSNAADADHDLTVGIGAARDDTNVENITLASAITKRFDATWAVGTANGGMQSGTSIGNDTWYEVHAIKRLDTGVVDVIGCEVGGLSLPSGYDVARRIGYFLSDGSANIVGFKQAGSLFEFDAAVLSVDLENTVSTTASAHALTAPPNTEAIVNIHVNDGSGNELYVAPTNISVQATSLSAAPLATVRVTSGGGANLIGGFRVRVDASSEVRLVASTDTLNEVQIATLGWVDTRGRDA